MDAVLKQRGCSPHSTLCLKQKRRSQGKMRGRNMPEGSAPIDASYALSAWIDTKFWHHKSERGGDGSSVGSACLRA